jgi:uncharacterized membrane protein
MRNGNPEPASRTIGRPILAIVVSFPMACFCGALATDIAYALTANMMWTDFSAWLLAAGMLFGALAAIGGFVDVVVDRRMRAHPRLWPVVIGSFLVLSFGLLDNLIHSRDAWTSVMPFGLVLSAVTVVVTLVTAWLGYATASQRGSNPQYLRARQ